VSATDPHHATHPAPHRTIEAVWRIESARVIAGLTRLTRDVGLAEDLAQEALVAALEDLARELEALETPRSQGSPCKIECVLRTELRETSSTLRASRRSREWPIGSENCDSLSQLRVTQVLSAFRSS